MQVLHFSSSRAGHASPRHSTAVPLRRTCAAKYSNSPAMVSVLGCGWKLIFSRAGAASARSAAEASTSIAPSRRSAVSASLSNTFAVSVST